MHAHTNAHIKKNLMITAMAMLLVTLLFVQFNFAYLSCLCLYPFCDVNNQHHKINDLSS